MRIGILGGGSWGTALGAHCARRGHDVKLWAREPRIVATINDAHANPSYVPGVELPAALHAVADRSRVAAAAELLIVAIPSEYVREICRSVAGAVGSATPIVSVTKGLELGSLKRMTEVAAEELPGRPLAVLSGPSFALEVARELPTAVVVASRDTALAEWLQRELSSPRFRPYVSEDLTGVELSGALKNVIAIAAGIVDGLGYGHNTVAALITRGLAEMARLVTAAGGRSDTVTGLAGLGDLVLTCTGALSRNRRVGQALGRGLSLEQATHETAMVAEGVRTTLAACALAQRHGVELPIAEQMREVLYAARPPREAVDQLMLRALKRE